MPIERREFLKTTGKPSPRAATLALGGHILGANDKVRVAICGTRGRGVDHIHGFAKVPNAQIVALCDVDENVLNQRLSDVEKLGIPKPKSYTDIRKLLEDKDIDAISIATPNHWHSLMGIWAVQAGKDVYVEKPCSHNTFEGRQLVAAVKKYNRICQHGSQWRSNPGMIEAMKHLTDGTIGDVYMARGLCFKWRPSIGHAPQEPVPAGVHYDLWTGPAPLKPFTKNRFHYNWHWIWDTGNGDIGNQAIHEIDIARAGLGVDFPTQVSAIGAHFMFDDDQETPNTLNATYLFEVAPTASAKMMEIEVRHWITNHEAEIGTGAYGGNSIPPAGLQADEKKPAEKKPAAQALPRPERREDQHGRQYLLRLQRLSRHRRLRRLQNLAHRRRRARPLRQSLRRPLRQFHRLRPQPPRRRHPLPDRRSPQIHHAGAPGQRSATASAARLHFDPTTEQVLNDDEANTMLRGTYRAPYVVPDQI